MSTIRDTFAGMSREDIIKALEANANGSLSNSGLDINSDERRNARKAQGKPTPMDFLNAQPHEQPKMAMQATPMFTKVLFGVVAIVIVAFFAA